MKHARDFNLVRFGTGIGFPVFADKHDKLLCSWDSDFKVVPLVPLVEGYGESKFLESE